MCLNRGFSLIELMVAVAIMVALGGIVLVNLGSSRAKSRDLTRINDISYIQKGLTDYYENCRTYPIALVLDMDNGCPSGITLANFLKYMPTPPPGTSASKYSYFGFSDVDVSNFYGVGYSYITEYILGAELEKTNAAVEDGPYDERTQIMSATPYEGQNYINSILCDASPGSVYYCIKGP